MLLLLLLSLLLLSSSSSSAAGRRAPAHAGRLKGSRDNAKEESIIVVLRIALATAAAAAAAVAVEDAFCPESCTGTGTVCVLSYIYGRCTCSAVSAPETKLSVGPSLRRRCGGGSRFLAGWLVGLLAVTSCAVK